MPKRWARSTSRASCSSNSRRLSSCVSGSVLACFWISRCRRAFSIATAPWPTRAPTRSASSRPNGRSGSPTSVSKPEHALLGDERRRQQRRRLVADHGLSRLQCAALDALAVAHGRVQQSGRRARGRRAAAARRARRCPRRRRAVARPRPRELDGGVDDDLEQAGHVVRRGECGAEALSELLYAPPLGVELVDALLQLARHVVEDRAELRELVRRRAPAVAGRSRPAATARMPSANPRSVWVSERTASAAPTPISTSSRPMSSATRSRIVRA